MLSVGIPHRLGSDGNVDRCVQSLGDGYDELIVVTNALGIPKAFNQILRAAAGDFIAIVADDCYLSKGSLRSLPDERGVTVPIVNGRPIWNPVYCFPRWVINAVGPFDEGFSPAYFEDDDMIERLRAGGIPIIAKSAIHFEHPSPGSTITSLYAESASRVHLSPEYRRSYSRFIEKWGRDPMPADILMDEKI